MRNFINGKDNIIWITNLRAIAVMAVVLLHIAAQMNYNFGKIPNSEWWASNFYINLVRFSVPVFVMLTGALTLGREYKLKEFFNKRFSRILYPFLFWSFIYIFYDLLRIWYKGINQLTFQFVFNFIHDKLAFGASYQMWYVYMLIGLYLVHPIINKWIIFSSRREQLYFLLLCLFSFIIKTLPIKFLETGIDLSFFAEFLGYLVLGYYISHTKFNKKTYFYFIICFLGYLISLGIIMVNCFYSSLQSNASIQKFRPWDLLQTLSIFILFFTVPFFNRKNKLLFIISKYSYGIYLIHVLIMDFLAKAGLAYYSFNPYFSIPITFVCTIVVSTLTLWILEKFPLGKYIVK